MRAFRPFAFLFVLLLVPPASAWAVTLHAPEVAGARVPFLVEACVEAPPAASAQVKVGLVAEGREVSGRLYGPAFNVGPEGRACRDVRVDPGAAAGAITLVAKARPEGGSAKAEARHALALVDAPVALVETPDAAFDALALRVPAEDGVALVPLVPGARIEAPALAWRIEEVRAGAVGGVVLRNLATADASTRHLALSQGSRAWTMPAVDVPPGGAVLVGPQPAPDVALHAPLAWAPRAGPLTLAARGFALDAFDAPRLAPGDAATRDGLVRQGVARVDAAPVRVAGEWRAYVTPDAGAAPLVDLLDAAAREVVAEWFTLTSPEVAAALARALDRGVQVEVLLEGAPAGGVPPEERALVAALVARGARVAFLESAPEFPARYRTMHAKLVVVDGEWVHVATENPTPSSYPARPGAGASWGAGLAVRNATLAALLRDAVRADLAPWPDVRAADPARLEAPAPLVGHAPEFLNDHLETFVGAWNVTPVFAPHGSDALVDALRGARVSVDAAMLLVQPTFGGAPNPFVDALVDAARAGARVRLLLDARHDDGTHEAIAVRLNALAAREGLALEARLAPPEVTLHAKLVVLDGERVAVGSMNWGEASARRNREAGLLVDAPPLAEFYRRAFGAWWDGRPHGEETTREVPFPTWGAWGIVTLAAWRKRDGRGAAGP